MAAIDHSAYTAPSHSIKMGEGVFGFAAKAMRALRTQIAYRRTLNELRGLSTRQLADIGLEGADLRNVASLMAQKNTF